MRSKKILSAAAFVFAFLFSTVLASLFIADQPTQSYSFPARTSCFTFKNNSSVAVKIVRLIDQDKRNGRESERVAFETSGEKVTPFGGSRFALYAAAVERYVDDSSDMTANDLPTDFQAAWREHMKAWRDYSDFLNRLEKPAAREKWSSEEFEQTDDFHSREISRTWYEVLRIGRAHGADVY